jgi:DNA polymerase III delta prime subunit
MQTSEVISITKVGRGRVINLTVEKNHTFLTENGVVTHNCDRLTSATQDGLKAFQEDFSNNAIFIFTTNHPKKIIPAIHSRAPSFSFVIPNSEKPKLAGQMFKSLEKLLNNESISYSKEVLQTLVLKHFPDFRRTIGELQLYSNNAKKEIDIGILGANDAENAKELLKVLREKSFKGACQWVAQNSDMDCATMYRFIFDTVQPKISNTANLVLNLAEFQYKEAFMQDRELNSRALFVELMGSLNWKTE